MRLAVSAITGGVIATVCLLYGLKYSSASSASLLLNTETAATSLLAWLFFREHATKRAVLSVALTLCAGALLSFESGLSVSVGALLILTACLAWGIDNNVSSVVESVTPRAATFIKCLSAGSFNILAAMFIIGAPVPAVEIVVPAVIIGFLSYGLSIQLYVLSARNIGASRSQVIFATNPFIGVLLSIVLLGDRPGLKFYAALFLAIAAVSVLYRENHHHAHSHDTMEHEHEHAHNDEHHTHKHAEAGLLHTHRHLHVRQTHEHAHFPDIHHRHGH